MTMPLIGNPITMGQINEELLYDKATTLTLNDDPARALAEKLTGQISLYDFYGKNLNISDDYGWFAGGGSTAKSTIDRITFATDTTTASVTGSLSIARRWLTAVHDKNNAWFAGGSLTTDSGTLTSIIDKKIYSIDMSISISKGKLPVAIQTMSGCGNTKTTGWFGGGTTKQWRSSTGILSNVTTLTFAIDTAINAYKGSLSLARSTLASVSNLSYGWFGAGFATNISNQFTVVTTIDRIDFANDTVVALVRGSLISQRCDIAAAGNPTDGWFVGGDTTVDTHADSSRVDRITFATDSNIASAKANIPLATCRMAGSSNNNSAAWFAGGLTNASGVCSSVYKLIFATDTVPATLRGPLAISRDAMAAT